MRVYRRDFAGPTRGVRPTPQGGLCVEAAVARTGVLDYSDGTRTWREYRPAEEVFAEDSLATLRGAPVTDDHPEKLVDPTTFKAVSRGHAEGTPRRDGDFVVADLMVQDAELCELVKTGARREVSCGYTCEVDHTPGVTPEGEKYDGIQGDRHHGKVACLSGTYPPPPLRPPLARLGLLNARRAWFQVLRGVHPAQETPARRARGTTRRLLDTAIVLWVLSIGAPAVALPRGGGHERRFAPRISRLQEGPRRTIPTPW